MERCVSVLLKEYLGKMFESIKNYRNPYVGTELENAFQFKIALFAMTKPYA